jgi:hypothetical protein
MADEADHNVDARDVLGSNVRGGGVVPTGGKHAARVPKATLRLHAPDHEPGPLFSSRWRRGA